MATAEFAAAAAAAGAHPHPHHPSLAHAVMGQPIIDMGLNGDSGDSRKRPLDLDGEAEAGFAKRTHIVISPPLNTGGIFYIQKQRRIDAEVDREVNGVVRHLERVPYPEAIDANNIANIGSSSMLTIGGDDSKYMLKMLIPSTAAGSIIGKGGMTIAQIQRDTGTNIKLSKANDFYPGTTERVALITGTVEALQNVCAFIIEKVKESPQLAAKTGSESITPPERARQVKVVVPNSTAGLIIGKGGSMIKSIMEQSSARVQISQKSEGITLSERVITVSGEVDANKKAIAFIVAKVQEDPQSGSCNNLSYAAISGPVANANPTGSPFAESVAANVAAIAAASKQPHIPIVSFPNALPSQSVVTTGVAMSPPTLATFQGARMPSSLSMISPPQFSHGDPAGVNAALNTLASHYNYGLGGSLGGHLPPGLQMGATSPLLGATAPSHTPSFPASMFPSSLLGSYGHQISHQMGQQMSQQMSHQMSQQMSQQMGHLTKTTPPSPAAAAAAALEGAVINGVPQMLQIPTAQETIVPTSHHMQHHPQLSPGTIATVGGIPITIGGELKDPTKDTVLEVEVPETLVGAILGKGGKTLVEFQNYSGAKIQISKKGEYIPGTRNRKVTITGSPTAAQTAHFLVAQRIAQEEQTRAMKGQT